MLKKHSWGTIFVDRVEFSSQLRQLQNIQNRIVADRFAKTIEIGEDYIGQIRLASCYYYTLLVSCLFSAIKACSAV